MNLQRYLFLIGRQVFFPVWSQATYCSACTWPQGELISFRSTTALVGGSQTFETGSGNRFTSHVAYSLTSPWSPPWPTLCDRNQTPCNSPLRPGTVGFTALRLSRISLRLSMNLKLKHRASRRFSFSSAMSSHLHTSCQCWWCTGGHLSQFSLNGGAGRQQPASDCYVVKSVSRARVTKFSKILLPDGRSTSFMHGRFQTHYRKL